MNQSLAPAFWRAIFAAGCLAIAKNLDDTNFWYTLLVFVGVILLAFAFAWGMLALLDRLNPTLYTLGDIAEKLLYPEIALLEKFSRLSPAQLEAYLIDGGERVLFIDKDGNPAWRIEYMGRSLSSDWISQYLYKANRYYPDLPTLRKNKDGTIANSNEKAFVYYLRAIEKVNYRKGRPYAWAKKQTPDLFRAAYFG